MENADPELIDQLYEQKSCYVKALFKRKKPVSHNYFILKSNRKSGLGYFNPISNLIELVEKKPVYGVKPRNAEQTFAIHALLNPEVKLMSLSGVAGTGKTLLASRLPGILPSPSAEEVLAGLALRDIHDYSARDDFNFQRPFRSPHHSATAAALVGGGNRPRPGEISLAHGGVLFLDELPEFSRHCLEVLREPMESGEITVARVNQRITYPARFQLVAAMNPCPCGYLGDAEKPCRCTPDQIKRYRSRVSGPLLDRIDLHVQVNRLSPGDLLSPRYTGEDSATVRARVESSRKRQEQRQGGANAHLSPKQLAHACPLGESEKESLESAARQMHLSGRGLHRTLRVARTIADLESCSTIGIAHISEALAYRG